MFYEYLFIMYTKAERQDIIKSLISTRQLRSQEQLLGLLQEAGISVTQATLSRDFNEIGVIKVRDAAGCRYALSSEGTIQPDSSAYAIADFSLKGVQSIEFSSAPIAVIKTSPGFAGALASILDTADHSELMGTIAGDDTILLIVRDRVSKTQLLSSLEKVIPGISSKLINDNR